MKWILLLLGAAAVLFVAQWAFLSPPAPSAPPPTESSTASGEHFGPGTAPPPPPAPPKPKGDPAQQPRLPAADSVPRRPPPPPPPGGAGEIHRTDLPQADAERVEALKLRLAEADLGDLDWKHQGLRRVIEQIAEKTGVPIGIEGEGLDDEPITHRGPGVNALEILRAVTTGRNLRFEVTPEKVVVRR